MSHAAIAKRYAKALLEIGQDKGITADLLKQLTLLSAIFEQSQDFRHTVLNPSIELDERKGLLRALAAKYSWHPIMLNFSLLILDRDRFKALPEIARDFAQQVDDLQGRLRAQVTSATPLSAAQQDKLGQALKALTGRQQVELTVSVDPSLLGGVVTRMGGLVVDGSIRTQLDKVRRAILQDL